MKTSSVVLGGGCFWCLDASYRLVPGVEQVTSGYAGGRNERPSYEEVCSGKTGHAEVVRIDYQPDQVSLDRLLEIFWEVHDASQVGGQGADMGTQYRSVLFYADSAQKQAMEASKAQAQGRSRSPITTEILPLETFWPAEEYHQDYFRRNPSRGYCVLVVRPKVEHIKEFLQPATR